MNKYIKKFLPHKQYAGIYRALRFIGPGILVTVGFIDPGNWATNLEAGSMFGYKLLWVVSLSTIMLIILQHNAAHLGIVTGKCLSQNTSVHLKKSLSIPILLSALLASICTAFAEILGAAVALQILFGTPIYAGALIVLLGVCVFIFTNAYRRIERIIIAFVSIIGFALLFELSLVDPEWGSVATDLFTPAFPEGSIYPILGILGAVLMPHNLFLHSAIIQSRQWNLKSERIIRQQLKYEFTDTLFSMTIGWIINSAMIILAAAVFYNNGIVVTEMGQASELLEPLLGSMATKVFGIAFLFAGVASSITAGMSGGVIFSGIFKEVYDAKDIHTRIGVLLTLIPAAVITLFVTNPIRALVLSQVLLCFQLPLTIGIQIYLTSSHKVMGVFVNKNTTNITLWCCLLLVIILNGFLIFS